MCGSWKLGQGLGRGIRSGKEVATLPDFKIFIYNEVSKIVYTPEYVCSKTSYNDNE